MHILGVYFRVCGVAHPARASIAYPHCRRETSVVVAGESKRDGVTSARSTEMAQVNPDPHAHGYVFIPTHRITSVFASYDDLQGTLRALEPLGFDPATY